MSGEGVRHEAMITLTGAVSLIGSAIDRAIDMDRRVAVVVLDRFGRMVAAQCMDGCVNSAFDVALAKARHAANFRRPTKFQEDLLNVGRVLPILAIPGMLPLEGGIEIQLGGETIGGVGVAGAAASEDGVIAVAGISAAGFNAGQPGELPSR